MAGVWTPHEDVNNNSFRPMKFTVEADATIVANTPVVLVEASNGIKPAVAENSIVGIAIEAGTGAASSVVEVWTSGVFLGTAGAAAACVIHDYLMIKAGAVTTVEPTDTAAHIPCGFCWLAASGAGTNVLMYLISQIDTHVVPAIG